MTAQGVLNVTGLRLTEFLDGWLRLEADIDRCFERMRISGRGEKLPVSLRTLAAPLSRVGGTVRGGRSRLDDVSVEFDVRRLAPTTDGNVHHGSGTSPSTVRVLGRSSHCQERRTGKAGLNVGLPTLTLTSAAALDSSRGGLRGPREPSRSQLNIARGAVVERRSS